MGCAQHGVEMRQGCELFNKPGVQQHTPISHNLFWNNDVTLFVNGFPYLTLDGRLTSL